VANYWTICWKCNERIKDREDSNYVKTRNGNFDFCSTCYNQFIQNNNQFMQPERSKQEELENSYLWGIKLVHDHIMNERGVPYRVKHNVPPVLIHRGEDIYDCGACQEMIKFKCYECVKSRSK